MRLKYIPSEEHPRSAGICHRVNQRERFPV
jgi:hypothetical protein